MSEREIALAELENIRSEQARLMDILQRAAVAQRKAGDKAEAARLRQECLRLSWQNLTLRRTADAIRLKGDLSGAVNKLRGIADSAKATVSNIEAVADALKRAAEFIDLLRRLLVVFK